MRKVAIVALLLVGCESKRPCVRGHVERRRLQVCDCALAASGVMWPVGEIDGAERYVCDERVSDRPSTGGEGK